MLTIKAHLSKFIVNRTGYKFETVHVTDTETGYREWQSRWYEPGTPKESETCKGESEIEAIDELLETHELEDVYVPDWYVAGLQRLVDIYNSEESTILVKQYVMVCLQQHGPKLKD